MLALVLVELLLIIGVYISYNNKNLDKYAFGKSTSSSNLFAVMIEDTNGNYQQSTNSSFPGYEYFYNHNKSGCMNKNGKKIEDSLLYDQDNKKATIKVNSTSMCYLYFDKYKSTTFADQLIDSGNLWQSNLEGDGYRFTGTNPNNYVCFGTTDKAECIANQEKYMYRIIGVFSDINENSHVKIIKYKQLSETLMWNYSGKDADWENSLLESYLNDSKFLNNATYDYLQNSIWLNKIENWTWSAVNTKTYDAENAIDYSNSTPAKIYLHEMNQSTKTSAVGEWTNPSSKIGLMYVSDYALSLGSSALAITESISDNKDILKTGWIHQSNNDISASEKEHLMSRAGSEWFFVWNIFNDGAIFVNSMSVAEGVRPVFYLTGNQISNSGIGTLEDPFILDDNNTNKLNITLTNFGEKMSIKITKGEGNLYKYCVNKKNSLNDCDWKNITATTIDYTMDSEGTYYVHVVDDMGYIANSLLIYKKTDTLLYNYLIDNYYLYDHTDYYTPLEKSNIFYIGECANSYRYRGTSPNNFICFGTTDSEECKKNYDKYLYRIIEASGGYTKLIKYTQIGPYKWNATNADVNWEDSSLYKGLNGSYFLTNTTYDYMQNDDWISKIADWTWSAVNTKAYEDTENGISYYWIEPKKIMFHELNKCNTYSAGTWTNPVAKIGLLYVNDFTFSMSMNLKSSSADDLKYLKSSWINPNQNDTTKSSKEWSISRLGVLNGYYQAYFISTDGITNGINITSSLGVRPVFYLKDSVKAPKAGDGNINNPFILSE